MSEIKEVWDMLWDVYDKAKGTPWENVVPVVVIGAVFFLLFKLVVIILILIKFVFAWKCGFETGCVIYIFQWMVVGTYFYVTYRPQFKKIDMKKFLIYFMKGVLGEEAARCIVNDKEKK